MSKPHKDNKSDSLPSLKVAKKLEEMPIYDAVISGTTKQSALQVPDRFKDSVVVVQAGRRVYIVADSKLHGSPESTVLFQELRGLLLAKQFEEISVVWAISTLMEQLGRLKNGINPSSINSSGISAQTETAALFRDWVHYALEENASDIHVEVRKDKALVRFRIDGALEVMRGENAGQYISSLAQNTVAFVYNKMTDAKSTSGSQFQSNKHMYSMVSYGEGNLAIKLRCQTISLVNGFDFVARILRTESRQHRLSYRQLGYTESQSKLIEDSMVTTHGLTLISGITGSGKTTTLKTMMQSIPGRSEMKLVSIEDPVEYIIEGVSHTSLQRDVSNEEDSVKVFGEAVKSWMRGDPDIMMIGEIRDSSSGVAALTQAETGHMALGTVHANSAVGIVQRLVSPAIGMDLHALTAPNILSLLIYQALVPKLCPDCKIPIETMPQSVISEFRKVAVKFNVDVWSMCFKKEGGCEACKFRGTKGMTVVAEIIKPDRKFLALLRERREFDAIDYWLSHGDGAYDSDEMKGKTVFQHAFYMALQGLIDPYTPERFEKYEHVELVADRLAKK